MELELGLKSTETRENVSSADPSILKDLAAPPCFFRETETMFILTAQLKGFEAELIKFSINQEGTQVTLEGEKTAEEMLMAGFETHGKRVEYKIFSETLEIPDRVVPSQIKMKFNHEDSNLTILMPKLAERVCEIEEHRGEQLHKGESVVMTTVYVKAQPSEPKKFPSKKTRALCFISVIAGSALLASVVAFAIHVLKKKKLRKAFS
ncbi:Alpha crystallin/Hsp20 domain [Dillenia turbinata]|uniref:Alpha crystallin/Hsp20 domain n=1 Tax=Dillenia turbinata TaxID=194707 RepID=A0AAN8ZLA6_9MAGN